MESLKEYGQIAYETYIKEWIESCKEQEGSDFEESEIIDPPWNVLDKSERHWWNQAAMAVLIETQERNKKLWEAVDTYVKDGSFDRDHGIHGA